MSVSGLDAAKDLLVNTIASAYEKRHRSLQPTHDLQRRHQALHSQRTQTNVCQGCKKTFSRLDALNVSFTTIPVSYCS